MIIIIILINVIIILIIISIFTFSSLGRLLFISYMGQTEDCELNTEHYNETWL